jgi:hypothetical protein
MHLSMPWFTLLLSYLQRNVNSKKGNRTGHPLPLQPERMDAESTRQDLPSQRRMVPISIPLFSAPASFLSFMPRGLAQAMQIA